MYVPMTTSHIQKHIFYFIDSAPNVCHMITKTHPCSWIIGRVEWDFLRTSQDFLSYTWHCGKIKPLWCGRYIRPFGAITVRTDTSVQNSKLYASCHKATVISWVEIERGSEGRLKGAGREGQGRRVVTVGLCMGCVIKLVSANSFCLDTVFLYRMTNTHCFMLSLHVLSNFASVWYMPLNCLRSLFSIQPPWWDG